MIITKSVMKSRRQREELVIRRERYNMYKKQLKVLFEKTNNLYKKNLHINNGKYIHDTNYIQFIQKKINRLENTV